MVLLSSDDPELDCDRAMIAEVVCWNYCLEMLKFHDGRKNLDVSSHSLQVLRNEPPPEDPPVPGARDVIPELHQIKEERNRDWLGKDQLKTVLMGHISSSNLIFANDDFYRFNVDKIIRGDDEQHEGRSQDDPSSRRARLSVDIAKEKRLKRRKAALLKNYFTMSI